MNPKRMSTALFILALSAMLFIDFDQLNEFKVVFLAILELLIAGNLYWFFQSVIKPSIDDETAAQRMDVFFSVVMGIILIHAVVMLFVSTQY